MRVSVFASRLAKGLVLSAIVIGLLSVSAQAGEGAKEAESARPVEPHDTDVTMMERRLHAARQRDDQKEVERLENRLRELRDERMRLLRSTWQM